ncbi:GumC family protein [Mesorhizobium sp. KR9-304]|uniref:GumC family protein n=1 Tax=Mesorhizobium sp. KR9-304 TaxID=3156614 RepID=UPI0032B500D7
MSSDWDMPETYRPGARPAPGSVRAPSPPRGAGVIDPIALFRFILDNIVRIGAIAIALTVIGIVLVSLIPFPYRATATVLVDPRNQQVTLQEDVLQPIGSDAAVLESMIQIMRSDGFLLTVMDKLGMLGDVTNKLSEDEQLKALARFKSDLSVERKGATYLVEVSFKAGTAEEAARIANSVANEFADAQNGEIRQATEDAGRALSERLVDLRRKLNASEKAVADFAAENGILYIDDNDTLQMRQLTELSAQLALAKNATEAARARYQSQTGGGSDDVVLSDPRNGETAQLSFLRQQRAQLKQTLDQQSLTYGSRHPRIAQTRQALEGIERQIREERQNLTRQLKGELDVAESQQKKLEADIAKLSSGAVLTDTAKVRLEALRREASADRDIYEKFLSRNKTTDELALINIDNIKVISPAVPPLRSSRPSMTLLAPVFGLLGGVAATTALAVANRRGFDRMRRRPRIVLPDSPPPSGEPMPEPQVPANDPELPDWQPMRARKQNNALLALADEKLPERVPDPHRPAAKSLLMMAQTMRDADALPHASVWNRRAR